MSRSCLMTPDDNAAPFPDAPGPPGLLRLTWLDIAASHSHASAALPRLHSACMNRDFVVWSPVHSTTRDSVEEITCRVLQTRPDLLAATVWLFNRRAVLAVAARVRAVLPDCRILLGGPEWLGNNETFLQTHPEIFAVFRGEGELSFGRILDALRGRAPLERLRRVPGLCLRLPGGEYIDNGAARVPAPLERLPSPLLSPFFPWNRPFAQLETSRGCPFSCSFCTSADTGPVREFPIARVRSDLETCRARGIREVRWLDRCFNANPARAQRLLAMFRNEFPDMRFHLEWRPEILTPELETALHQALPGQLHLEIGIQTLAPAPARAVARGGAPARAWAGACKIVEIGTCRIHLDLLAGLPNQDLDSVLDDIRRLIRLGPDEIQLETLKILPGTSLAQSAAALGLIHAPDPPYEILRTPHLSPEDLRQIRAFSRLIDRFYNPPELQPAFRAAVREMPEFFSEFTRFLEQRQALDHPLHLERRFRLLHAFATRCSRLENIPHILAYSWLRRGLSPQHGLVPASPWKQAIPRDAVQIEEGSAETGTAHKRRVWHVQLEETEYWFVFPAGETPKRSAPAVFRRGLAPPGLPQTPTENP